MSGEQLICTSVVSIVGLRSAAAVLLARTLQNSAPVELAISLDLGG